MKIKLKWWWYILPVYLTLWTIAFSLWNLMDGNGMMEAFGVDTGGASPFIMLNSAGRYVSIAVAMVLGIWVFSTFHSILLALIVRLTMDVLDLGIGLQTGLVEGAGGVIQSLLMFIIPNIISLFLLFRLYKVPTEN
ncbi:MAG: hypothetical protein F6K11_36770 [Leptolyngbya sp. SIO3F4]|nr:hypothetical protein [Leptolyngbya sp. SIO3F4]